MTKGAGNLIPADRALEASPVAFNFDDIRAMAAALLRKTRVACDKMLSDARKQVAAMEKKAHDEGFAAGRLEGAAKGEAEGRAKGAAEEESRIHAAVEEERAAFRAQWAPASESLSAFMAEAEAWRARLTGQAEADLLRLSMDIARRIVLTELSVRPEAAAGILREAMALATRRTDVEVSVHPGDLALLEAEIPALRAVFPDLGAIRLAADPSLARGGVAARTREGEVDLRLATRLAAFERALLGVSGPEAAAPWAAPEVLAALSAQADAPAHARAGLPAGEGGAVAGQEGAP